jgi:hypothetical protein
VVRPRNRLLSISPRTLIKTLHIVCHSYIVEMVPCHLCFILNGLVMVGDCSKVALGISSCMGTLERLVKDSYFLDDFCLQQLNSKRGEILDV